MKKTTLLVIALVVLAAGTAIGLYASIQNAQASIIINSRVGVQTSTNTVTIHKQPGTCLLCR
jgi:hypothetical protein